MSAELSITNPKQGVKSISIPFVSSFGHGLVQNTTYYLSAPKTQVIYSTSVRDGGFASPYDGYIVGCSCSWSVTTTVKDAKHSIFVRIKNQKQFFCTDTKFADYLVTNQLVMDVFGGGQYVECRIPIKKGQVIEPSLVTGTFTGSITTAFNKFVFIIESKDNKATLDTENPDIETQTVYHNYGTTGGGGTLNPLDSSFYFIPYSQWGSLPSANGYGNNISHKSRLYGRITSVGISYVSSNATPPTSEPLNVEIHIRNSNFPSVLTGIKIIKIGEMHATDMANNAPMNFPCDIPISRGQYFNLILRNPAWVTNPTAVMYSGLVFIEGVSSRQMVADSFGTKSFDAIFNSATNNSFAINTSYYYPHPQFNSALITNGRQGYEASPYDGHIVEMSLIVLNVTIGTLEPVEIWVDVKNPKSNKVVGSYFAGRFVLDTNAPSAFNRFIKCKIPVKKGELFTAYYKTPNWGTPPTNVRPHLTCHIRGN